jgi:ankyrin repeat protein
MYSPFAGQLLRIAVRERLTTVVKFLIDEGIDVNWETTNGSTILELAGYKNKDTTIVKLLIENGALINVKDEEGSTPLHSLVTYGFFDNIKILVENGADINSIDGNGNTPFLLAINRYVYGFLENIEEEEALNIVKFLLYSCPTDKLFQLINVKNSHGEMPLDFYPIGRLIREKYPDLEDIGGYCKKSEEVAILIREHLIKNEIDLTGAVEFVGSDQFPIQWGMKGAVLDDDRTIDGHPNEWVKKNKILFDVNKIDEEGNSHLHFAVLHNWCHTAMRIIYKDKTTINTQNGVGETPLHKAVIPGLSHLVRFLLEQGADTTLQNNKGETPLDLAKRLGNRELEGILKCAS